MYTAINEAWLETRLEVANQLVLEARKVVERQRQQIERRKASNLDQLRSIASEL